MTKERFAEIMTSMVSISSLWNNVWDIASDILHGNGVGLAKLSKQLNIPISELHEWARAYFESLGVK